MRKTLLGRPWYGMLAEGKLSAQLSLGILQEAMMAQLREQQAAFQARHTTDDEEESAGEVPSTSSTPRPSEADDGAMEIDEAGPPQVKRLT